MSPITVAATRGTSIPDRIGSRTPDSIGLSGPHTAGTPQPPTVMNRIDSIAGVKAGIGELLTGFPDFTVTNEQVIAMGDTVVVRSTVRGTHTGPFIGIPPTGKPVEFAAIDIWRVADGQLVEVWHVEQLLTLLIQLGVAPPRSTPAPATPGPAMTTSHPVIGSWQLDSIADDPANPPALAIFNVDGTYIELHEREADGAGIWTAIDAQTAAVTIVYHQVTAPPRGRAVAPRLRRGARRAAGSLPLALCQVVFFWTRA